MQRFTISLDDELGNRFDGWLAARGYATRSEAVRDLIRERLGHALLAPDEGAAAWCAATVSYVFHQHETATGARLAALQHAGHDLVVSSLRTHLDHDNCLETVVLRGPAAAVQALAAQLVALRGVRHGQVHALPLAEHGRSHRHAPHGAAPHRHLTPAL